MQARQHPDTNLGHIMGSRRQQGDRFQASTCSVHVYRKSTSPALCDTCTFWLEISNHKSLAQGHTRVALCDRPVIFSCAFLTRPALVWQRWLMLLTTLQPVSSSSCRSNKQNLEIMTKSNSWRHYMITNLQTRICHLETQTYHSRSRIFLN
jgi:hypothetical protein